MLQRDFDRARGAISESGCVPESERVPEDNQLEWQGQHDDAVKALGRIFTRIIGGEIAHSYMVFENMIKGALIEAAAQVSRPRASIPKASERSDPML